MKRRPETRVDFEQSACVWSFHYFEAARLVIFTLSFERPGLWPHASALQLAPEFIHEAPVCGFGNDFVGVRLDHAGLAQPQRRRQRLRCVTIELREREISASVMNWRLLTALFYCTGNMTCS
jgi:hypothetical protein